MKYDYERIALWSIVTVLVLVVFFQQRRSGFSLQSGSDTSSISMLDMMEYRYVPEMKRAAYKNMLMSNATTLSSMTDGGMYRMKIEQMMMTALKMPSPSTTGGPPSTTGGPPATTGGPPTSGIQSCTGVIIVGDCVNSNICPLGLITLGIGNLRYCVCPEGQKIVSSSEPGRPPACAATCPTTMPKLVTESATGQQMCAAFCPTSAKGYTCV